MRSFLCRRHACHHGDEGVMGYSIPRPCKLIYGLRLPVTGPNRPVPLFEQSGEAIEGLTGLFSLEWDREFESHSLHPRRPDTEDQPGKNCAIAVP
jgi:hypothetical protein